MKLLGLSGSLTEQSKTLIAVEKAIGFVRNEKEPVQTEVLNLRDYEVEFCDGRNPEAYQGDTKQVINKIIDADALIVGTPVYRGSYTSALKNVFDLIPNHALKGKVIGFIATGGTYHHFLAIEHQLKPLAGYFHAHVVPGAVYVHNEHYSEKELVDPEIHRRLQALATDVINLSTQIGKRYTGADGPDIPRKTLA